MRRQFSKAISVLLFALIFFGAASAEEYEVEAFIEVGEHTWNVPDNVDEVDVLIVGGGAGGGGNLDFSTADGGGGGAGGLVYFENYEITSESVSLSVGAGGEGSGFDDKSGEDGESSYFDDLIAKGGGGGDGNNDNTKGRDGGSGGGGAIGDETSGSLQGNNQGLEEQTGTNTEADIDAGNDGGAAQVDQGGEPYAAGGGGGASETGEDGSDGVAGDGGDGLYFGDIFGEEYGENGYFAAGGGGGAYEFEPGEGGKGGGGDGADVETGSTPQDAEENTGSGGGGGGSTATGGDGASGIVLIRYIDDLSICDRRGLFNECISNSTHKIDGEDFNLNSIFKSEDTSVFEALNERTSITVSNSSIISGTWRGSFSIDTNGKQARITSGAEFRPKGERIVIN